VCWTAFETATRQDGSLCRARLVGRQDRTFPHGTVRPPDASKPVWMRLNVPQSEMRACDELANVGHPTNREEPTVKTPPPLISMSW
jgi:hypothetical protein